MNEIRDKINVNIMNHGEMKYNVDQYIIIRFYIDILKLIFITIYLLKCKMIQNVNIFMKYFWRVDFSKKINIKIHIKKYLLRLIY